MNAYCLKQSSCQSAANLKRAVIACVAILVTCFLLVPEAPSQHLPIEYMMRIPKYYRLKGGSSQFSIDPTRGVLMFDGGPYDTYVTYDRGASWETIFDMKMFFVDVSTQWQMDGVGNWYYQGLVYNKLTINLVTEDAGKTIRYLVVDTADLPSAHQNEQPIAVTSPRGVFMEMGGSPFSSCDVGRTWMKYAGPQTKFSNADFAPVGKETINLALRDIPNWVEYNICDGSLDTLNLSNRNQYRRLSDGTSLEWGSSDPNRIVVKRPGADSVIYSSYPDEEVGISRKFTPLGVSVWNDTMALIIAKNGVVATYCMNTGWRYIDIPPYRNPYQNVCDWGAFEDRIVLRTIAPSASSDALVRYTIINMRTGDHHTIARPSTLVARYGDYTLTGSQRMVPYSDSLWFASFEEGELMRTTDAGATWTMVDNIDRDERWGMTYVGVNRLFPRGDGTMSVLTERSRLMLQDSITKSWYVAHTGPFVHSIKLANNFNDQFTKTNVLFGEDFMSRYRIRYGPSTAYFHTPDTIWTSGDVVTRWTSDGKFIDTTLQRRARVIKRVNQDLVVAGMDSVWFTFNNGKAWTYVSDRWPKYLNGTDTTLAALGDIVQADNKDLIVGLRGIRLYDTLNVLVDSIPGGIIRSDDSGVTWGRSTTGIPDNLYVSSLIKLKTGTLLCLALEVTLDPRYVTTRGIERKKLEECMRETFRLGYGYIYRSTDNGRTWTSTHIFSSREFVPHVDPAFTLMPDGRPMAIHPDVGMAISPNDGVWFSVGDPWYIGNPNVSDVVFTDDGYAHFATDSGYLRIPIDRIMDIPAEQRPIGTLNSYINASRMLQITNADFIPQTLRILSLDGRTVAHGTGINGITEIDVSTLVNGTYVVTASTSTDVRSGLIQIY